MYDLSNPNLVSVFDPSKNLVADLIVQLNKDLETDHFSETDRTVDQFLKKIEYLLKAERSSVSSLLYRIDVPEEIALEQENYQTLSLAVLIREAQKVSFRKIYSSS
jgi:hypothetical protein